MARSLTGKVIIVTGASSGIGAATAIQCAKAGMHVVLNARRVERLNDVAAQIHEHGGQTAIVPGDVVEPGVTQRMLDAATDRFGRFDAVFANAGYGFAKPGLATEDRELRDIFETNFFAAVELLREAGRRLLKERREGHLLMCSSCVAKMTLPGYGAYSATKAAQNHICRAMNIELKSYGIKVSSVHPITTTTEFFEVSAGLSGKKADPASIADHTPKMFIQSPHRVGRAIVKCLKRPKPEVWTSFIVRFSAALFTLSPRLMDIAMHRVHKAEKKAARKRRAAARGRDDSSATDRSSSVA